ncbi:M15 family metallopeptidase [Bacillus benzoevorans]|uniref:D-alanyl-D-alanine carboxypeptidase n=1 Tax=Bacillus benzoevorans TaxID=1456 RepID=A0A7X0LVZ4_9BACI|nr:M15 family metallopeptidase [Bacillus benzoevorans]MBB6446531.1 D-alanyl-D-alanine carboxypeptidase [Bacillus benzoevorans]
MKRILLTVGSIVLLSGCGIGENSDQSEKKNETVQEENQNSTEKQQNQTEQNHKPQEEKKGEANEDKLTLEAAYFNKIAEVDGKKVIQNPENILVLVNKEYGLPDGYAPADLVRPNVAFSFGDQDIEKSYMRKEAAMALEKMFTEAANHNLQLYAVSGYRSYERQVEVFNNEVQNVGREQAVQVVAVPGNSEHQTGLSMDISSASANSALSEQFGETPEGKWLVENAHKFGFILRYPKGKEAITGYQYESWHFRYVGVESASGIYENGLTLEEYFHVVEKI